MLKVDFKYPIQYKSQLVEIIDMKYLVNCKVGDQIPVYLVKEDNKTKYIMGIELDDQIPAFYFVKTNEGQLIGDRMLEPVNQNDPNIPTIKVHKKDGTSEIIYQKGEN
jgi:hypothetical protein